MVAWIEEGIQKRVALNGSGGTAPHDVARSSRAAAISAGLPAAHHDIARAPHTLPSLDAVVKIRTCINFLEFESRTQMGAKLLRPVTPVTVIRYGLNVTGWGLVVAGVVLLWPEC